MILAPHVIAGAAIGSKFSSLGTIFLASLAAHYFLDLFPHSEYQVPALKKKGGVGLKILPAFLKIGLDVFLGFLVVVFIAAFKPGVQLKYILFGAIVGILPDFCSCFTGKVKTGF